MNSIVLMTDTSSDLTRSTIEKYNITQIPFFVSFNQEDYFKEIVELSIQDFYKRMRDEKVFPKTSLPSINDYYEVFEPQAKAGNAIICVCLSAHFSGSYNSAVNARELILENYPNTDIAIINSLNATGGEGLLVTEIARMIEAGLSFERIVSLIPTLVEKARIFFAVDTLDYLEHSGRIGKASALVGTMLNVKPIIYLENGVLYPATKVRGKKKAFAKLIEMTRDYVGSDVSDYNYIIGHADNIAFAQAIQEQFNAEMPLTAPEEFFFIGTTIGVNTGPDACGICVIPKYETLL